METNINTPKQSNFVKISIIIAIVIVMNMFFNYAVSLVYKEPVMDNYIKPAQVVEAITTKDKCIGVGGQWSENAIPSPIEKGKTQIDGYCNENYTNQLNYDAARKVYEKKVFITLISLGVISLIAGGFISISILSIAFAWGGVLSLIIASMRYWSQADNLAKVIILALALGILIWLAVKKFNK
ncbi:MAG: hypothetical protein NTV03_03280 [Candidatus Nomurabacteria bacterium]|nr:hypothetical protein [Candidatus Nomurabacteria bacterium]